MFKLANKFKNIKVWMNKWLCMVVSCKQVTLWGYSAGGSSTMVQAFYKGNKGLIKRGIPVTGGAVDRLSGEWNCDIR